MYDYFSGLWKNREKALTVGIIIAFLLLAVGWICYSLGIRNTGGDVPDNGIGIDDVREQYQHIEVNQQQITSGLAGAVERSDTAAARAGRIEERAGAAAQSVGEAGRLLDECQQIVGTVRNRGKK
jgi:hypothetical protein